MVAIKNRCLAVIALLLVGWAAFASADDAHLGAGAAALPSTVPTADDQSITGTETLVFLRHGEKPAGDIGQLTTQGLNRALALSKLLPVKYGKPDYLFAPDPTLTNSKHAGETYAYVRPLATIEPTAILLGLPVQIPCGYAQIDKLDAELTLPKYAHSTLFVAWEHHMLTQAASQLMSQFGGNQSDIPRWQGTDFDSLYVLRIKRTAGQPTQITFTHDQEGLDHLSMQMPEPAAR